MNKQIDDKLQKQKQDMFEDIEKTKVEFEKSLKQLQK